MTDTLISPIAASLGEWDVPHVELANFGTAEPVRIAGQLEAICLVVKAHQPSTTREGVSRRWWVQLLTCSALTGAGTDTYKHPH